VVRRFDTDTNVTPFLKALDTLRREGSRQGQFPEHVATIIAMINQYAESALGDRHYFCEEPHVFPPGKSVQAERQALSGRPVEGMDQG
jgi:hypothetical protein